MINATQNMEVVNAVAVNAIAMSAVAHLSLHLHLLHTQGTGEV